MSECPCITKRLVAYLRPKMMDPWDEISMMLQKLRLVALLRLHQASQNLMPVAPQKQCFVVPLELWFVALELWFGMLKWWFVALKLWLVALKLWLVALKLWLVALELWLVALEL